MPWHVHAQACCGICMPDACCDMRMPKQGALPSAVKQAQAAGSYRPLALAGLSNAPKATHVLTLLLCWSARRDHWRP